MTQMYLAVCPQTRLLDCRGANLLISYPYRNCVEGSKFPATLGKSLYEVAGDVIADSGAFTYMAGADARQINWDEYAEQYASWVRQHQIKKYMELDIDGIIGLKEVERIRDKLTQFVGWPPIPVWHKSRGWGYFEKMCDEFDYVAYGGIALGATKTSERGAMKTFIRYAHSRGVKIHGLGFTPVKIEKIKQYPFDSIDSSTWSTGLRYGAMFVWKGHGPVKVPVPSGMRLHRGLALYKHQFDVWKKYCDYIEYETGEK